ncbi:hypothetical protein [Pedobacter aquatilis]|uniref:hypothetical protein n=1 Tax=Pedobacter aquatilis TaxID=351343 RepID=UPI002931E754|nr:hypothetical protein [Pedobacter aquatilis]
MAIMSDKLAEALIAATQVPMLPEITDNRHGCVALGSADPTETAQASTVSLSIIA